MKSRSFHVDVRNFLIGAMLENEIEDNWRLVGSEMEMISWEQKEVVGWLYRELVFV